MIIPTPSNAHKQLLLVMAKKITWLLISTFGVFFPLACHSENIVVVTEVATQVATQVPTEVAPVETQVVETVVAPSGEARSVASEPPVSKELVVCLPQEPDSLYYYGDTSLAATAVYHAIYENNITSRSFAYQPQGLVSVPTLDNGDVTLRRVEVQRGDLVVDADQEVVFLESGITVINAEGEEVTFDGRSVFMAQMAVKFTMKPRQWSDGTPVTAADSVYSFELHADPATPADKFVVSRTASYTTSGPLSTRWVGVPGFRDETYFLNFWSPLPRHAWQAFTAADLLEADVSTRSPIGDGPFMVTEWVSGDHIRLAPNPHYYRADEGLPHLDSVVFKFVPLANEIVSQLLSGECDIGTKNGLDIALAPFLLEAAENGFLTPYFQPGTVYEHIDFGVNSYGGYGDGNGRPDWFEDVRVRQAMTMCTDRQRMIDTLLYGRSQIMHAYLPTMHPLYPPSLVQWPYDPTTGNQLLSEAGLVDTDGDGIREDAATGAPFVVVLLTTNNELRQQSASIFRENMRDCGIEVELGYRSISELYANDAGSPLFGRRFDLVQFGWPVDEAPRCDLYASWQITGPAEEINPATGEPYIGWQRGLNNTGWWSPAFDAACQDALDALPRTSAYETNHQQALQIFAENLPVIPLFLRLNVAATRPGVVNFKPNPSQPSDLWNLFEIDLRRETAVSPQP